MMQKEQKQKDTLSVVYNILSTLRFFLICLVLAALLFTFVIRKEQVKGTSMYPILKDGQNVIINVAASYMSDIQRFDVVVVKNDKTNDLWVKRVIGLPGETIAYKDDLLYVNDKAVKEPFLNRQYVDKVKKERMLVNFTSNYKSKTLGADEYLLVGDNRVDSIDSRYQNVGPFKRNQIIAKGVFIITPFSEMRYVGNGG